MVKFLLISIEKPLETVRNLQVVYEDKCKSKTRMFEWAKRIKWGRKSVEDGPCEGASVTSRTIANVDRLRTLITSDGHLRIHVLSCELLKGGAKSSEQRPRLDEQDNYWR